jgi:integrase
MPTTKLTQAAVERLKATEQGRMEYWDTQLPGFGLRISDSGRKIWIALYRVGSRLVRETIGTAALIPNVAEARERARQSMQKAQAGENPVVQRRERERAAMAASEKLPDNFRAVADRFVERYAKENTKPTTWMELRRQLEVDVLPKWADRPIASITRQDVTELLNGIADRGSPVQANRTLTPLKTLFRWVVDEELVVADPTARVRKIVKETARDRVLSDLEIRLFWAGCDKLGWPFGPMFKVLLLTAQRRDEVGGMEWSEIAPFNCGQFRARRRRTVELTRYISRILPLRSSTSCQRHRDGVPTVAVWSQAHTCSLQTVSVPSPVSARLRSGSTSTWCRRSAPSSRDTGQDPGKGQIEGWILHDLRCTAATGMARLNIAPHVVDRTLNHVSGTIRGVAAVYNRHAYLDDRKAWGRYVECLIRPPPENVVVMPYVPRRDADDRRFTGAAPSPA